MLDIKFVRENPDAVKENIKKKFQDAKLPLVDEVIEKDAKYRACLKEVEALKAARNKLSKANGPLFGQLKKCTDEAQKAELQAQIDANNAAVKADADKMAELEKEEETLSARIQEIMYTIPQMIDPSVPIGPDDTYNVEAQRFGEPVVPDFPIPYHTEIMESFDGIDMDAAGRVAGNGFYYLLGRVLLVALHAEEADFSGRNHLGHAVQHAQTRAQHRHDNRSRGGDVLADHRSHRGFDGLVHDFDVAGGFVGLEHHEFGNELAERGGRSVLVAKNGELVIHQRVVQNMNIHGF